MSLWLLESLAAAEFIKFERRRHACQELADSSKPMAVPLNWPLNVTQYETYFIVQKCIDSLVQGYIISTTDAAEITQPCS